MHNLGLVENSLQYSDIDTALQAELGNGVGEQGSFLNNRRLAGGLRLPCIIDVSMPAHLGAHPQIGHAHRLAKCAVMLCPVYVLLLCVCVWV